jgi:hypothetical protein
MADAAFWNLHVWEVPRKDRVFRGQNPLLMDYSDEQLRQRYRFGRDSLSFPPKRQQLVLSLLILWICHGP